MRPWKWKSFTAAKVTLILIGSRAMIHSRSYMHSDWLKVLHSNTAINQKLTHWYLASSGHSFIIGLVDGVSPAWPQATTRRQLDHEKYEHIYVNEMHLNMSMFPDANELNRVYVIKQSLQKVINSFTSMNPSSLFTIHINGLETGCTPGIIAFETCLVTQA